MRHIVVSKSMKKNNLTNIFKIINASFFIFIINISLSFAQSASDNGLQGSLNFKAAANNITNNILTSFSTLLMTGAFVLFFWGVVRFIYDRSNGDDTKLAKDKEAMLWGLAALFIMVSTWGIIKMFQGFLGIQNNNNIQITPVSFDTSTLSKSGEADAKSSIASNIKTNSSNPFEQSTNKPQGANCVGQPGSLTQCASGLLCRDTNGNPVAQGQSGTCKATLAQDIANLPTIEAPSQSQYVGAVFSYLKYFNCVPSTVTGFDSTYDSSDVKYVQNFQKANDLKPDGIIGPNTWRALNDPNSNKCQ